MPRYTSDEAGADSCADSDPEEDCSEEDESDCSEDDEPEEHPQPRHGLYEERQAMIHGDPDEWHRPPGYEQQRYMHRFGYECMPGETDEAFYIRKVRELAWIRRLDAELGFTRVRDLEALLRTDAPLEGKKRAVKRWRGWVDHFVLPVLDGPGKPFHGTSPNCLPSTLWLHRSPGWHQYQRERELHKASKRDPVQRAQVERERRAHQWLVKRVETLRNPTPRLLQQAVARLKTLQTTLDEWMTRHDRK